jgi:hypothetical protein
MNIKKYKKGEKINFMCFAGEDMIICENYGISANMYEYKGGYVIPLIESISIGSGKCLIFLREIEKEFGKIIFTNVKYFLPIFFTINILPNILNL